MSNGPVIYDSEVGRNGGLLRDNNGAIYRVRQHQGFNNYGEGLSIAKITTLAPDEFAEEEIRSMSPDIMAGIDGVHHMHSDGSVTALDFVKTERTSR